MRKYATISLQVPADDGLATMHSITDTHAILGVSLAYSDELPVDPAKQLQALADELEAEATARRSVQTELDREKAHTVKLLDGLRTTADAYAALKNERDALLAELAPWRKREERRMRGLPI